MGCNCGKPKCDGQCGCKSPAVLQINNPPEYITFHKVSVPAVMGDSTTNPPAVGKYKNVLLYYEADQTSWLYSTDGIPTKLTNGLTDYNEAVNLPQINGHTLIGDQSSSDLGLQGELTAGTNIQINGNVISATDTTYTAGNGIELDDTEIKAKIGDGLEFDNNGEINIADIEQYAHFFDTVSEMQSATNLIAGSYAHTLGYHSVNDGGNAYYKITDTEPSTHYETITGGLYAELLYLDDSITPSKFGAYHDGTHDDSDAIQDAMDVLGSKAVKILDLEGYTYYVSKPVTLPSTYRATVKNGEIKALADFTIDGEDTSKNYIFITSETNTNTYPEAFGTFPTEDLTIDRINLDAGLITGLGCMILNKFLRVNITNCQFKRYTTNGLYLPDKGSHEVNVNNCNFIAFLGSDEEALQIESYGIYNDSLDGMFSHLVIIGGKYGIYNNKGANIFTAIHPYGQLDYTIYHNAGVGCTYDQIYFDGKGMYVNRPWLTTISNSYFLVNATPLTLNSGSDPNTAMKGFKVIGCVGNNYSSDLTITAISLPTGSFKVVEECEFDLTTTNMVDNRYLVNVNKIMKPQVVYLDSTQQEISMSSNGTITDTATNTKFTKTIVNNVVNVTAFNTTGWSQLGIVVNLESNKTYKIINKYTHDQKDFKVYAYSSIATSETPTVLKSISNDTIGYQTFDTGANTNFVIALLNKGVYELEITEA